HAAGRADLTARYHLAELAIHVPVSVLLILRLGVLGAALAWLLRVLLDTGLLFRAGARLAGVSAWSLWRDAVGRGVVVAALLLPLVVVAGSGLATAGRVRTMVTLGLIALGYVPAIGWLGLPRDERAMVRLTARTLFLGSAASATEQP